MFLKEFSTAVMVSDAKKTAKWFRNKLGFEVSVEGHWVTTWPAGSNSKLHLCEGKLEPGNTGIGFYSKDVEKDAKKLKAARVRFSKDVTKTDWGTYAKFLDPDGNEFWLTEGTGP
jgi:lactoylglutathione lyase